MSKIEKIFGAHKANENQIIHGDFSPGNVLFCSEAKVIDPRSFLWGEESLDAAKWALSIKRGRSAEEGVRFFTSKGFSEQALYFWLLIQAYDDSSAFASFPSHDDRIESYSSIVKKLIKLF